MNTKRLYQIAVLAALVMAAPVQAVTNYSCDFENKADRDRWKLNPTANKAIYDALTNKWYIGEPGNNDMTGNYGLYISDNNGASAHYSNNGCWVFAYDTVSLDKLTSNDYTLCFDYCGMGNIASNFDGIYVLWIPMTDPDTGDSIKVGSIATSSGLVPSVYGNYVISLQPQIFIDYIGGTQTWKQCVATIPNTKCDGKPHYLAFVWANGSALPQQSGAMIDNIQVLDTRPCDEPTGLNMTIQGTTTNLTWNGTASSYEVTAYSYETDEWYGPKIVNGTSTSFANLPVGQTDFIVRSICASDLYSLKTSISKLVYYPDQMCVDYLNLNNAKCYTGTGFKNTTTFNNYVLGQPVDMGPAAAESRHTIHFDKMERDPRSNGMLPTVPVGELASVRLGNYLGGNQTERIEFSFNVDTINYPVLLLKYAPILEAPTHSDTENPRFMLDIRIGNQSIGECGQADFNANTVRDGKDDKGTTKLKPEAIAQGWHVTPKDLAQANGDDVIWKEWTTVGVNLKKPEYQGKKLTVRLSTFDCAMTQHGGYAYFTLGCSDGKLKGMKCGAINPVFEAPDGFVYRWAYAYNERYRNPDGSMPEEYVLGHDQKFEAGMQDDSVYVVDCMFVQDSSCFFSLYASTLATNPIAMMNEPKIIKNCRDGIYKVQFDASPSWVQEIDHVKGDTIPSRVYHIDRYEWNIDGLTGGWSDEVSPIFDIPTSGGDYTVRLTTSCGACDSTIYYHLHLDSLDVTRDTIQVVLCDDVRKGEGYVWSEKPDTAYHAYGLDSVILYSETTSCDSIIYLNLTEPVRIMELDTMVLPEQLPFYYRGRTYYETTIDTVPISDMNCDTTFILSFEVYESVIARLKDTAFIFCEGDAQLNLIYDILRGRSLRYSYAFDQAGMPSIDPVDSVEKKGTSHTLPILFTPAPSANVYTGHLLLEDSFPQFSVKLPFRLTVQYNSAVITQRWNDVLAIRNADYNGGYEFDSVQWYVSGLPIEGAIDFNYYAGMGNQLQFGKEYTALLTRKDGVKLFTCPFVPAAVPAEIADLPSLVPLSAPMHIRGTGTAYWYDMLGRVYGSSPYNESDIIAPATQGCYLLVLQNNEGRTVHQIMVR